MQFNSQITSTTNDMNSVKYNRDDIHMKNLAQARWCSNFEHSNRMLDLVNQKKQLAEDCDLKFNQAWMNKQCFGSIFVYNTEWSVYTFLRMIYYKLLAKKSMIVNKYETLFFNNFGFSQSTVGGEKILNFSEHLDKTEFLKDYEEIEFINSQFSILCNEFENSSLFKSNNEIFKENHKKQYNDTKVSFNYYDVFAYVEHCDEKFNFSVNDTITQSLSDTLSKIRSINIELKTLQQGFCFYPCWDIYDNYYLYNNHF